MKVRLRLEPLGTELLAEAGTPLRDLLFACGVEFPCGGKGTCGRCRVRVLSGNIGQVDGEVLACRARVESDTVLQVGGWQESILSTHQMSVATHRKDRGIAVDLGTTTVVAELVDGETGSLLGIRAELNEQASFGSDVMTRIEHALTPEGRRQLQDRIVSQIRRMIRELSHEPVPTVIAGNTAMHHLFGGLDVEPLSHAPFRPTLTDALRPEPNLRFLPPIGGFVGSDILAGVLATGMDQSEPLCALLDLGTNGEIVVGNRHRMLCASTAAGPAFEGGRVSCGMRASTGAISGAEICDGKIETTVLGGAEARGVCGSGLVDCIAAALDLGLVGANGRVLTPNRTIPLQNGVTLLQSDVRELQLAKGAIAAGLQILLKRLGATHDHIRTLYLAGAFGNYVRPASAERIGLLPFNDDRVQPVGNAALAGAKLVLFTDPDLDSVIRRIEHVPLHTDEGFEEAYVTSMRFPES